ncbi:hypothetical protein SCA6_012552 [Theobroma cacao]
MFKFSFVISVCWKGSLKMFGMVFGRMFRTSGEERDDQMVVEALLQLLWRVRAQGDSPISEKFKTESYDDLKGKRETHQSNSTSWRRDFCTATFPTKGSLDSQPSPSSST